jgi:Tol biopolymer transport system component
VLAFRSGSDETSRLLWFDRAGKQLGMVASEGGYGEPALSRDGRRVAVVVQGPGGGDVWIYDAAGTDRAARLTFGPRLNISPVWSPDGKRVAYNSRRKSGLAMCVKSADNSTPEESLLAEGTTDYPCDWSPDGRVLLFERWDGANSNLFLLPMVGKRQPLPFLQSPASESHATFSPDGRYVAYVSNESATPQIFVQTVPVSGAKWQVSSAGGDMPSWRADGKELYYVDPERKLLAVPLHSLTPFAAGEPQPLFTLDIPAVWSSGNRTWYAASPDGSRFLVDALVSGNSESGLHIVLNWLPPQEQR